MSTSVRYCSGNVRVQCHEVVHSPWRLQWEQFPGGTISVVRDQSFSPDELVVCDDSPPTGRWRFVREFQGESDQGRRGTKRRSTCISGTSQRHRPLHGDIIFCPIRTMLGPSINCSGTETFTSTPKCRGWCSTTRRSTPAEVARHHDLSKARRRRHRLREFATDRGFEVLVGTRGSADARSFARVVAVRPADTGILFARRMVGLDASVVSRIRPIQET